MTGLAKNTAAMNRAGAACGCGALIYLAARSLLTRLASLLLALRVPGASLQNPAGASQLEAALLRIGVSGLALAAPFLLLAVQMCIRDRYYTCTCVRNQVEILAMRVYSIRTHKWSVG